MGAYGEARSYQELRVLFEAPSGFELLQAPPAHAIKCL